MSSATIHYQEHEFDYQADHRREETPKSRRTRNFGAARRTNRPAVFNGIHRRRTKRWTW